MWRSTRTPSYDKVGAPYPTQRAWLLGPWIDKPRPALRKSPLCGQRPSSGTPEKSPYVSPLESCPSYILGPRSTRTPSHHKDPGAPGRHHTTRTQEHPDTFTTKTTRWDPGAPDAIGLGGPRCNQTILDQENPEVPQTSLDQEIPEAPIIL
ncbi:hypothetical protein STEG23_036048 [Scotinomys teguina]